MTPRRSAAIADQAAGLADLVHHVVTGVDAQSTGDAGHLLPVADNDPHRADVHAGHAVDTIALRRIQRSPFSSLPRVLPLIRAVTDS